MAGDVALASRIACANSCLVNMLSVAASSKARRRQACATFRNFKGRARARDGWAGGGEGSAVRTQRCRRFAGQCTHDQLRVPPASRRCVRRAAWCAGRMCTRAEGSSSRVATFERQLLNWESAALTALTGRLKSAVVNCAARAAHLFRGMIRSHQTTARLQCNQYARGALCGGRKWVKAHEAQASWSARVGTLTLTHFSPPLLVRCVRACACSGALRRHARGVVVTHLAVESGVFGATEACGASESAMCMARAAPRPRAGANDPTQGRCAIVARARARALPRFFCNPSDYDRSVF